MATAFRAHDCSEAPRYRDHVATQPIDTDQHNPEKDATIEAFRTQTPVLLSTQSGCEGRNEQFCNTLITFDLP